MPSDAQLVIILLRRVRFAFYSMGSKGATFYYYELDEMLIKGGITSLVATLIISGLSRYYNDMDLISMEVIENLEFLLVI